MTVHLEKVLQHAERELVHRSHLAPTDLLDIYRRFLKLEEHRLKLEHNQGESGRELARKRADVITVMLRHIWTSAWETHRKSHFDQPPRIALLAVGGFGRGELNPYSDIDVLFLYANDNNKSAGEVNDIVQHILYMLWDIGFQVGHATRTMSELVSQANGDLRTKTSLLEARYLSGDEMLFTEFEKTFERRCLIGHEKEYLEWRVADQHDRHVKAGNTPFLQEPNVKNGCRRFARLPEPALDRQSEARHGQHAAVLSTPSCSPPPSASSSTAPTIFSCASAPSFTISKSGPATC